MRSCAQRRPRYIRTISSQQIFTQPYSRIGNLIARGIAKRQTASTYLRELVRLGVLEEEKIGRDKIFLHRKYLDLLSSDGAHLRALSAHAARGCQQPTARRDEDRRA